MTLFPRQFEDDRGIDTSAPLMSKIPNAADSVREGTIEVIINGSAAPTIMELPEDFRTPELGSYCDSETFWFGEDSVGSEGETMYLG